MIPRDKGGGIPAELGGRELVRGAEERGGGIDMISFADARGSWPGGIG